MMRQTERLYDAIGNLKKLRMLFVGGADLSPGEGFVLSRVGRRPNLFSGCDEPGEGPPKADVFVSDLGRNSHMTLSAISQSLSALERKGLVVRTMSKRDRRRISVTLTPEGEALLARMQQHTERLLADLMLRFGEEDTRALADLLEKLGRVLEQMERKQTGEEERL